MEGNVDFMSYAEIDIKNIPITTLILETPEGEK